MRKNILFLVVFSLVATSYSQKSESSNHRPAQVTFFYPLGTNGTETGITSNFSFNILAGCNGGVNGFELGGLVNINQGDVKGCQIGGLANLNGGNLNGLGIGGLMNGSMDMNGCQIGGLMNTSAHANGCQIAGLVNHAKTMDQGLQIAGLANCTQEMNKGAQIAGLMNCSGNVKGFQLAGLMNITKKSEGVMLAGLLNIADSAENTLAFINIVKYNGKYRLTLWTDETYSTNLSFKSGVNHFYGIVGIGYNPFFDDLKYSFNYGIGYRAGNPAVAFDLEALLINNYTFEKHNSLDYWMASLRPMVTFCKIPHFEISAGLSFNYLNTSDYDAAKKANLIDFIEPETSSYNNFWTIGLGANVGVSYVF